MTILQRERGKLFVLIGPGGAGKNALMTYVLTHVEALVQLATATTRPRRDGEQHGRERLFVSPTEFRRMIEAGELLEWQEVTTDRFYGIPRASVDGTLERGIDLIADIDVKGAEVLRQTHPEALVLIFVTVPGDTLDEQLAVLRERMISREEDPDVITERLERAHTIELPFAQHCDYVIVNDDIDEASQELMQIILEERKHTSISV